MDNFKSSINLSITDLKARRSTLEEELKKTVVKIVIDEIKEGLEKPLMDAGVGKLTKISWEFHPESDDEGGTDYYPNCIQVFTEDGEMEDIHGEDTEDGEEPIIIKRKSSWSDTVYEYSVGELVSDLINENSDDLYNHDIEEITFQVGEE